MDLQVKSWLEKAKRLHLSVKVTLRSDSSDELTNSDRRFFGNLKTVRGICHKQKNSDKPVHSYVHMLGSNISVQYI